MKCTDVTMYLLLRLITLSIHFFLFVQKVYTRQGAGNLFFLSNRSHVVGQFKSKWKVRWVSFMHSSVHLLCIHISTLFMSTICLKGYQITSCVIKTMNVWSYAKILPLILCLFLPIFLSYLFENYFSIFQGNLTMWRKNLNNWTNKRKRL